ncbi:MAG TPA: PLAT/LH2 domain-containing protein, partial [Atribacterota bacterium]|nr:PLAT/LH2 domain-containing protein [Atribacterota bacterium]
SNGGRVLSSNIPIFVSETEKGSDIDSDGDGILQEWEDEAMEYINPYIELDEEEDWLTKRDTDHVANYVRIHPSNSTGRSTISYHSENLPHYIIFRYVVTWSQDYGRFGVTAHKGDHERIFMAWKVIDNKNLRLEWVFKSSHEDPSAHHGVWNAWHRVCNKGDVALNFTQKMYSEVMCSNLEFYNNRLLVYASEGKHAIYPSCDLCENVNLFIGVAGEDCGGGGTFRFDCYNVGEPPEFIDPAIYDLSLDRGKLEKELPEIDFKGFADKLSSRYRIQIKTGNEDLSGTDAKISIKLFGSEGTSSWYDVYSKPSPPLDITIRHLGTFEKGDTDNIYVNSSDLGEINKIQIKHDNTGPGPGWLISEILVEDLVTHATWHARPNTWLDKFPWQDNTNKTFNLSSTP